MTDGTINKQMKTIQALRDIKTCVLVEALKERKDICKSMFINPDCCYYVEVVSPLGEILQHETDSGAALVLIITD